MPAGLLCDKASFSAKYAGSGMFDRPMRKCEQINVDFFENQQLVGVGLVLSFLEC
jgi:hypothetical protein